MHLTVSDGVILLVLVSLAVAALNRRLTTPGAGRAGDCRSALGIAWGLLPLPAIEFPPALRLEAELDRDLVRLRDHANSAALPAGDTAAK